MIVYSTDDANMATYLIQTAAQTTKQYAIDSQAKFLASSIGYTEQYHWDISVVPNSKSKYTNGNLFTISQNGKYLTYRPNANSSVTLEDLNLDMDGQLFSFVFV
jgi:hypothetical protein